MLTLKSEYEAHELKVYFKFMFRPILQWYLKNNYDI